MFDQMITSGPDGVDEKSRRGYFAVSALVVGVLFIAGVVASIFADDFALGRTDFELETMLAPVEMSAEAPEPQRPRSQPTTQQQSATPVSRMSNMSRVDEPTIVPTTTSSVPNSGLARPNSAFTISNVDSGSVNSGPVSRNGNAATVASSFNEPTVDTPRNTESDIKEPPPARKHPPQTKGVINGMATSLPKPVYSAAAMAVRAEGKVDVQVTVDETGKVISAHAASGHPLLRPAAEKAAWNARFTPTLLSGEPVKVTGVIVYNFVR